MAINNPTDPSQTQSFSITDAVIKAKHVTKNFEDEIAVREVTFDVPRASIFGFIGPSGSGKTTTWF